MSTTETGSRSDARSIIEELWAEREQSRTAPPVQRQAPAPPPPKRERPGLRGKERALATAVVLLLIGNGLGVGAKALGLVGGPSKSTFLAEADAICSPVNAQLGGLSSNGYPSLATASSTFVTTAGTQLQALRSLDLPAAGDRGRARGVLAAMSATVDAGRLLQTGAGAGDAAMTAAASRTVALHSQDAATKAQAFGFTACATGMKPGVDGLLAGADGAVKGSLIQSVGVLCADLVRAAEALPVPKTVSQLDWFITQSTALYDTFVTGLRALPVPRGDEATVAGLATGMADLGAKVRQLGAAASNGDVARTKAIEKEGDALAAELDAKYSAYGFTNCGS